MAFGRGCVPLSEGFSERRRTALISDMDSVELAVVRRAKDGKEVDVTVPVLADATEEEKDAFMEMLDGFMEFCRTTSITHIGCKPHKGSAIAHKAVKRAGSLQIANIGHQCYQFVNNYYKTEQEYERRRSDPEMYVEKSSGKRGKPRRLIDYSDTRFVGFVYCTSRLIENQQVWKDLEAHAQRPSNADCKPWKNCP
jgi:hypothetical protein